MLARPHALRDAGNDGIATAGRLHHLPLESPHPVGRGVPGRNEQPPPSLVQSQQHGLVTCLLAFGRLAALVGVEMSEEAQRFLGHRQVVYTTGHGTRRRLVEHGGSGTRIAPAPTSYTCRPTT